MSRIDDAAVEGVDQFAVRSHHFKHGLEFGVHEIFGDGFKRGVDALFYFGTVAGCCAHASGRVDENHGDGMALGFERRFIFGLEDSRSVDEIEDAFEKVEGAFGVSFVTGGNRIFCQSDAGESLGEDITAHAEGSTVGSHFEIHAAVCVIAVGVAEVDATFGEFEIFGAFLDVVVGE